MSRVLQEIDQIEATRPNVSSPLLAHLHELLERYAKRPEDLDFLAKRFQRTQSEGMLNVLSFLFADKLDLLQSSTVGLCVDILDSRIQSIHDSTVGNFFVILRGVAARGSQLEGNIDWAKVCNLILGALRYPHPPTEGVIAIRDALTVLIELSKKNSLSQYLSDDEQQDLLDLLVRYPYSGHDLVAPTIAEVRTFLK